MNRSVNVGRSEPSPQSHRISAEYLLQCGRWQQSNATFPVEPNSHNKKRKRKNDSSGSSSTALRDNIGIGFRLRVFKHFSFSLFGFGASRKRRGASPRVVRPLAAAAVFAVCSSALRHQKHANGGLLGQNGWAQSNVKYSR